MSKSGDPLPPFWPTTLRQMSSIFFGTFSLFMSLAVIGAGLTVLIVILGLILGGDQAKDSDPYEFISGTESSQQRILKININGPILGSPTEGNDPFNFGSLMGITYGYDIQADLKKAADDKTIKAVFLEITTPGGTIFGSQAIYDGIKAYQEKTGHPVYAFVEGLSASGGVWAMVGADKIYADYGSYVGSIGILGPNLTYYNQPTAINEGLLGGGVTTTGGIESVTISGGRGKDLGNPFRRPTPEELQQLQAGVDQEYSNFVNHVAQARQIKPETLRTKMGAMIFGNQQAQAYGLIDGTRNRPQTLEALAKAANIQGDYALVRIRPDRQSLLSQLLESSQTSIKEQQAWLNAQTCTLTQYRALAYYGNLHQHCQTLPPAQP
ncbi:S49 family peptidase [Thermosynechococcaceae cyanobacterium BACA0444]|uniref:S49 family peptidase n=1 Tax=Pseudocalidococcus azoricus BACA0444 TaxID=2918990 RepID=A0AAE4FV17_9CYAN|nr:S49 family peptidase [Pseudocalidococcus azoricus]MDS3862388.1 S49 family peptidase [Pseudocalidococcus azoricus BACA0444]